MSSSKKEVSLAAKKAYSARSRRKNYQESLRLEGFESSEQASNDPCSKSELIAKHRAFRR